MEQQPASESESGPDIHLDWIDLKFIYRVLDRCASGDTPPKSDLNAARLKALRLRTQAWNQQIAKLAGEKNGS